MTALTALITSITAAAVPGVLLHATDPAAILGYAVVATCIFFGLRDYAPRPVTSRRR